MKFAELVETLEDLEATSSGNEMRNILARLFKKSSAQEIASVTYLVLGEIDAEFKGIVTGMANQMVIKSISLASGKTVKEIKAEFKKKGDLGLVAEQFLKGKKRVTLKEFFKLKGKQLTPNEVIQGLKKIAEASGAGSQEKKIKILASMLQNASPKEAKYLIRINLGVLRIGVGVMTVLDALSMAFTGSKKNKPVLENAYNICTDPGEVAEKLASKGLKAVKKIQIQVGKPIKMMLAQRVGKLSEIKEHIPGKITAEHKYDGERIQVHKNRKGEIIIFSRRLENITEQFPDIVTAVRKGIKGKEFIIEGEVVPVDKKERIQPFQVLMQRRRKYDIEKYIKKIPVKAFFFDLLYLNGKSLVKKPYPERRKQLEKIVKPVKGLALAGQIKTESLEKIEDYFNKALKQGLEGVVCKSNERESVYRAGARAWLWIKWKKEYAEKMRDTFDLVVVGAFAGRGLRAGTYGSLLCASYNPKKDRFETVTKLGTGFTEKQLAELPKMLSKFKSAKIPARVDSVIEADYWFKPGIVLEVTAGEITVSPIHTCAKDLVKEKDKGLALRFPRMLRFRKDKSPEQATTPKEIFDIYKKK